MNIYSVKDLVSKTFIKPFGIPTDRDAIDGFRMVCNEKDTPYNKFPQDYVLVKLGKFDERTGLFETHEPETLKSAASLRKIDIKEE